jgi:transcriptional regulator with XRE-family HTH domain
VQSKKERRHSKKPAHGVGMKEDALLRWLRDQRKRKGLTLRQLGTRLGVHHSMLGRIEQGERRLDIVEFARLCSAIGCAPQDGLALVSPSPAPAKAAESRVVYGLPETKPRRKAT